MGQSLEQEWVKVRADYLLRVGQCRSKFRAAYLRE